MKTCLVKLILIVGGAVSASHAFADPPAQPGHGAATTTLKRSASAPRSVTLVTNVAANVAPSVRAAMPPASVTSTVHAAGSVLMLADGIVDSAAIAQIHPPAVGFVYER